LLPEHVEMLTCLKDWDLGARKQQHAPVDKELEEHFSNLFLDEEEGSGGGAAVAGAGGG
jgi:hypothetical protein